MPFSLPSLSSVLNLPNMAWETVWKALVRSTITAEVVMPNQCRPSDVQRKVIPPPLYKGVDGTRPLNFLTCCSISKRFCLQWKAFDLLNKLTYFMAGGAAGGLWRHQTWLPSWPPSWILSRIRKQVKTSSIDNFWHISSLYHFIHKPYFYCWKNLKHAFSLKNGLITCYLWRHNSEP